MREGASLTWGQKLLCSWVNLGKNEQELSGRGDEAVELGLELWLKVYFRNPSDINILNST